jgi:hypothetical protein
MNSTTVINIFHYFGPHMRGKLLWRHLIRAQQNRVHQATDDCDCSAVSGRPSFVVLPKFQASKANPVAMANWRATTGTPVGDARELLTTELLKTD